MSPRQFLLIGSVMFILLAVLGFTGVLGPTPEASIFHGGWWFDNGESWTYLVLGILAVIAVVLLPFNIQKSLVIVVGMTSILLGAYSLFIRPDFLGSNLERMDAVFHLFIGAWAFCATMSKWQRN